MEHASSSSSFEYSQMLEDFFVPEDITCDEQVFDIAFHPIGNYIAVGQVSGKIEVHQYEENGNRLMVENHKHKASCRGLLFSEDGSRLYSISSDKSILAIDSSGQQLFRYKKAHKDAINKIVSLNESHVFATGDDSGVVKVWDARMSENAAEVMQWNLHKDYVSGLCYNAERQTLLSVGGDFTLCAYDLRTPSNAEQSDEQEAELHCIQDMKDGRKVVCGTEDGVMLVFSWGRWGDCTDRVIGHPESVDCILRIDESTVVTGSSDGILRAVSIQPNKILGIIGEASEFPIEGVRCSHDRRILGNYSHDEIVRFSDMSVFLDDNEDDDDKEQEGDGDVKGDRGDMDNDDGMMDADDDADGEADMNTSDEDNEGKVPTRGGGDISDSSDDDDDDEEDNAEQTRRRKFPTAAEKFFSDL